MNFSTFKPMIRFLKSAHPGALFMLPVIVIALLSQGFFKAQFHSTENSGVLNALICKGFTALPKFVLVLFAIILVSFEAIYLNLLFNKYEVLYKATYLPALFYVLIMSYSADVIIFHPVLLVNLLLIPVIDKTFSLFKNDSPVSAIFDCCLLLSLCTLIYFPSIVLLYFFFVALAFLRTFHPREWLVAVVGFMLPFYFVAVYAFCTDSLKAIATDFISKFTLYRIERITLAKPFITFLSWFGFLFLIALIKLRANFNKNSIRTRGEQQALFVFLILILVATFFKAKIVFTHFTLLAIPVCTILAYFYASTKRRLV